MRVRINKLSLVGTSRAMQFRPGLNIISGPITTGKSTALRMCRGLLGSGLNKFPPEARETVTALAGEVLIGEVSYSIVRPFVTTSNTKVDIASSRNEVWRLPAFQSDAQNQQTYAKWLLEKLGLPHLEVPSAPTKPDSPSAPLSINDYFLYCSLPQTEIDQSCFSHTDAFKNVKRKYVFEVLYGIYNIDVAAAQEALRDVHARLREVQSQARSFDAVLRGTPWENRALLERELAQAREALTIAEANERSPSQEPAADSPEVQTLRARVQEHDEQIGRAKQDLARERENLEQLRSLYAQLELQGAKLTKSIVAETLLLDFEFLSCPRCGANIDPSRADPSHCSLCLQEPVIKIDRSTMIREQDRLAQQAQETLELIAGRERSIESKTAALRRTEDERNRIARDLDQLTSAYVSDQASKIRGLDTCNGCLLRV